MLSAATDSIKELDESLNHNDVRRGALKANLSQRLIGITVVPGLSRLSGFKTKKDRSGAGPIPLEDQRLLVNADQLPTVLIKGRHEPLFVGLIRVPIFNTHLRNEICRHVLSPLLSC